MTHDDDRFKLVDAATECFLADVGLPGHSLAETINPNGNRQFWLVDRTQLGDEAADHGDQSPGHELTGPLPAGVVARIRSAPIRCGARCADGHPCRIEVRAPGHACGWHRRAVR